MEALKADLMAKNREIDYLRKCVKNLTAINKRLTHPKCCTCERQLSLQNIQCADCILLGFSPSCYTCKHPVPESHVNCLSCQTGFARPRLAEGYWCDTCDHPTFVKKGTPCMKCLHKPKRGEMKHCFYCEKDFPANTTHACVH